mmetsp:Transcript_38593/g.41869  ORF Transcript_38593/g.41869 Transcript_38593/m.41869 type:complete len:211 (-) Transcript_38593:383-1015(-)
MVFRPYYHLLHSNWFPLVIVVVSPFLCVSLLALCRNYYPLSITYPQSRFQGLLGLLLLPLKFALHFSSFLILELFPPHSTLTLLSFRFLIQYYLLLFPPPAVVSSFSFSSFSSDSALSSLLLWHPSPPFPPALYSHSYFVSLSLSLVHLMLWYRFRWSLIYYQCLLFHHHHHHPSCSSLPRLHMLPPFLPSPTSPIPYLVLLDPPGHRVL